MSIYENIFDSVRTGTINDVMYFFEKKNVDINNKNENGETPLFLAVQYGKIDIFKTLVKAGADVNIKTYDGRSILGTAEYNGYAEIVKIITNGKRDLTDDELKNAMKASACGSKHCMNNDLINGIKEFSEAIRLDPNNANHYLNRGMIYIQSGQQFEFGIKDLTEAIKLEPYNAASYRTRGMVYCQTRQLDKGINDLCKAIELDPNDWYSYMSRGTIYKELHQYDKAKQDLEKVLCLNVQDKTTLLYANNMLAEIG